MNNNKSNITNDDIEFLTTTIPIIKNPNDAQILANSLPKLKDLDNEEIEMLTTSLPVIKDYTEDEINE